LLRGLFKAFTERGHRVVFFERDVPYYANHRDLIDIHGVELHLYSDWDSIWREAESVLRDADAAMITSYCPDGIAASQIVLASNVGFRIFYDLDTPVTLESLDNGESVSYIGKEGLADFDLVLSYTGGSALLKLQQRLAAKRVLPLYGSVDPEVHQPTATCLGFESDMSYLGTYAADRQTLLESFLIGAARRLPTQKFIIGGSKYPQEFPWLGNIWYVRHVAPDRHSAFYCSSPLTLNITRAAMARMGYCPSGRLFEAAACGTTIISDNWEGLEQFFEPGREIFVAENTDDVVNVLSLPPVELKRIGAAGRERVLSSHTARHRALEFESMLESSFTKSPTDATSQFTARTAEV